MEKELLAFALIMFILSQVSERISNFLKLWLPLLPITGLRNWAKTLAVRQKSQEKEKKREAKIFLLSWIAGMLTTGIAWKAIVSYFAYYSFPWPSNMGEGILLAIGSSLFLSFGSKFWHDLLDIVLLYKNANRALRDPNLMEVESIEEVETIMALTPGKVVSNALNDLKMQLKAIPGVKAVAKGQLLNGIPTLRLYFDSQELLQKSPHEVYWINPATNRAHRISIEKVLSDTIIGHSAHIGGPLFNCVLPQQRGTLGYVFKNKLSDAYYALTCYHVVKAPQYTWEEYLKEEGGNACFDTGQPLETKIHYGYRNEALDVAIIRLPSLDPLDKNSWPFIGSSDNVDARYQFVPVNILGNTSGLTPLRGVIYEPSVDVTIRYDDDTTQTFHNFFSICLADSEELRCPTKRGDSGGLVYHENGTALGFIVGGSNKLAYAMKISTIENHLGLELVPNTTVLS